MAVVSSLGILFDTNTGNHAVTATPALGDLIVIICANTGRTTAQPPTVTDNNTGGHGTYAQIVSSTKNTSADSMWIFIRVDTITSATSTIFTATQSGDTGGGLQVFKVTGMSIAGAKAARASGSQSNQAGSTTPAPAFPQAALTANACLGAVFNGTNPATLTAPAGWTESQDVGYITPTTGLETAFRSSGVTLTTITWGSATTVYCDVIVELDTKVPIIVPVGVRDGRVSDQKQTAISAPSRASVW